MEQLPCIAVSDLAAVRFADGSIVKPMGRLGHVLIGVIHRVQNALGPCFKDHVGQRLCPKGPAGNQGCPS